MGLGLADFGQFRESQFLPAFDLLEDIRVPPRKVTAYRLVDNPFSGGPPSHQPGGVVDGAALADHRVVLRFAAQRQRPSSLYGGMSCAPSGMGIPAETSCWYFRAAAFSTSDAAGFSIVAYAS